MIKFLILAISLVSISVNAKLIKDTIEPSEREIACFKSFSENQLVRALYPDLQKDKGWQFTLQVTKYCTCEASKLAQEWKEQDEDWIAFAFKDKSKMLQKRDSCSLNSFYNDNDLLVFYNVKYQQWFSPQIASKINKHVNGAAIRQVVGENKWMDYLGCAHEIVSGKCSRVKSLNVTYQCIKDNFDPENYDEIHRECIYNLHQDTIPKKYINEKGLMI